MTSVEVLGRHLEYSWIGPPPGDAPTIVFLHEGLGCVAMWRNFPDRLASALGVSTGELEAIESRITPETKAIMVVHLYGLPVDIDPVLEIAKWMERKGWFGIVE